jgi:sulfate adenylyltransferase
VVDGEERARLIEHANTLPSIQLTARSLCDVELLATGAFFSGKKLYGKADYDRVLEEMRLSDGTLFPMPITLPVADLMCGRAGRRNRSAESEKRAYCDHGSRGGFRVGPYQRSAAGLRND